MYTTDFTQSTLYNHTPLPELAGRSQMTSHALSGVMRVDSVTLLNQETNAPLGQSVGGPTPLAMSVRNNNQERSLCSRTALILCVIKRDPGF